MMYSLKRAAEGVLAYERKKQRSDTCFTIQKTMFANYSTAQAIDIQCYSIVFVDFFFKHLLTGELWTFCDGQPVKGLSTVFSLSWSNNTLPVLRN